MYVKMVGRRCARPHPTAVTRMKHEIKVPTVGESIQEVQIGRWLKGEGQWADKDENLVEIESDKATVELAAPVAGVLVEVLHRQGEVVPVGTLLAYLEEAPRPDGAKPPAAVRAAPLCSRPSRPRRLEDGLPVRPPRRRPRRRWPCPRRRQRRSRRSPAGLPAGVSAQGGRRGQECATRPHGRPTGRAGRAPCTVRRRGGKRWCP